MSGIKNRQAWGHQQENLAAEWLSGQGVKILDRRWRWARGEIDLVAEYQGFLVFIEVRTRQLRDQDESSALESINATKQKKIKNAAAVWLLRRGDLPTPWRGIRFDALVKENRQNAEGAWIWIPDAFC